MVHNCPEKIEEWCLAPRPMEMMVGVRATVPGLPDFPFEKPHDRGKDDRSFTPTAQPAIASEYRDLI